MAKEEVVVLDCWVSPFCMRAKIALSEKGVEFENREEDLFGGKSELLLKSNPIYHKVPVLLHNGKPLCESAIIVNYIDETWPSPPLLPSCAYGKAQARFWADYIDKKVFDTGKGIWLGKGEEKDAAVKDFTEILKRLDEALADKPYFGGDAFGFVDVILIPMACWFYALEKFGDFKVEKISPRISAWIKKCLERETVAKILPDPEKVCEFIVMMRKMHGFE